MIQSGESLEQRDNDNFTALAYAMQNHDLAAAERLLRLGARPAASVGAAQIPIAFLPLLSGDAKGVRLMRRFGVDYARVSYRGVTGYDLARQLGNGPVLKAIGATSAKL